MTILNVDDDVDDLELFAEAVKKINPSIKCLTAFDGLEAQLLLQNESTLLILDYIFLDINMPRMNGLELLAIIKKDKRLSQIPVCMLSTAYSTRDAASIQALGAACILKQSNFNKTVEILSSILLP